MSYYHKYLKYKNKYLQLQNVGGSSGENDINEINITNDINEINVIVSSYIRQ